MTVVVALLAGVGFALQSSPAGVVEGHVRAAGDETPLVGAVVSLVGTGRLAITDDGGRYILHDVPTGQRRIRATRIGYAPLEVVLYLPEGGYVGVDFVLTLQPVDMPPVTAAAHSAGRDGSEPPAPEEAVGGAAIVRLLDASPGVSETGIAATARALLGSDPPSPDNVLYVRGAGTALELVLLDGAPVHAPFHLGGLLEPGLPPGVGRAVRRQGGAPARYDGGLASVLTLESRAPPAGDARAGAFVDLLSAGGSFEGHGGGLRLLFSARSLHGQGTDAFVDGTFPQRYADALLRVDAGLSPRDSLAVTGFWNRESVATSPTALHSESPSWGNTAGSVRYDRDLERGHLRVGLGVGEFRTRLQIGDEDPVLADGRTQRGRLTVDAVRDFQGLELGYGVHLDRLALATEFTGRRLESGELLDLRQDATAIALAGYVDGSWALSPDLRLALGLRANAFSHKLGQAVSPRASVEWSPSGSVLVSVSAGRFHQLVVSAAEEDLSVETAVLSATDGQPVPNVFAEISAASASHFVVGATHAPRPGSELRLEGYWKTSRGLPVLGGADLQNTGFDLSLHQELKGVLVWGSYSMAWAWAAPETGDRTEIFAGRHFLRAGVGADLDRFRLEADVAYGAGLEFGVIPRPRAASLSEQEAARGVEPAAFGTAVPRGVPTSLAPILFTVPRGSYLRLNARASARFGARIFGHDSWLYPYVKLVNALDRPDALFYQYERTTGVEPRPIGAIPLLPVVGMEWRM